MSILALSLTLPAIGEFVRHAAGPVLATGVVIGMLLLFRPLLTGLLRAAWIAVWPHLSLEQRRARRVMRSVQILNKMAREVDYSQPNLAAELRLLAAND